MLIKTDKSTPKPESRCFIHSRNDKNNYVYQIYNTRDKQFYVPGTVPAMSYDIEDRHRISLTEASFKVNDDAPSTKMLPLV